MSRASVSVDGRCTGEIGIGFLALVGVGRGDGEADADLIAAKIAGLRVFADEEQAMNRSLADVGGAVLAVSQFTLYGDARHGRRPSFIEAERGEAAERLFQRVVDALRLSGVRVQTGVFGARMEVELINQGPVTILLDSRKTF